jgi:hypothetical protein
MTRAMVRSVWWLLPLAAAAAICVTGAMAVALVAGEHARLGEMHRGVATAIAEAAVDSLGGATPSSAQQAETVVAAAIQAAGHMAGAWDVEVLDPAGTVVASGPGPAPTPAVQAVRPLMIGQPNGWHVVVKLEDMVDHDLTKVLLGLLAGLAAGLWGALELLRWLIARQLEAPLCMLSKVAAAGAAGDFRFVPATAGVGEIGALRDALARFIGFLTLRRREVDLLLRDAHHDTYDPGVVARADAWSRRLDDQARIADDDPLRTGMSGDPSLRRLLLYFAALLLGIQMPLVNSPAALLLIFAAWLSGGRLLAWLPRWIGRRPAIAVIGGSAALVAWLLPAADATFALAVVAVAMAAMLHCAATGQAEPAGADGETRDKGALSAAAAGLGSAAILILACKPELALAAAAVLPVSAILLATFAITTVNEALDRPAWTVWPTAAEFVTVLGMSRLVAVMAGVVLPAASFVTAVLLAACAHPMPEACLAGAAAGLWAAPFVASRITGIPGLTIAVRLLPAPAVLAMLMPWPSLPAPLIAAVAGLLAGIMWHHAAQALYSAARQDRGLVTEQAALLSATVWRGAGLLLPVGAVAMGIEPVQGIAILGAIAAGGAVTAVVRRVRVMAAS